MILTSISSFSSSSVSVSIQVMDSTSSSGATMSSGVFFPGYSGLKLYYAGKTKQIKYFTSSKSYSFSQGYIMT